MNELALIDHETLQDRIYTIRGLQVMLDKDLALLYSVQTKVFNQAVKRNIERFPDKFRFQLTDEEYENLRSQFVTLSLEKGWGTHKKYLPYVFTEQGVSMLCAVLKSKTAIEISIKIIDTFVNMRKFISSNANIFSRFERIEQRLSVHDNKFNQIFTAIEEKGTPQKQHIFYDGQIFDAYLFVSDIIKSAKKSIKLIDNYIDESTLVLFTKREIIKFDLSHDRFLIIDEKEVYHFGASLKDLGKKWFAVSKMDINSFEMMEKLK